MPNKSPHNNRKGSQSVKSLLARRVGKSHSVAEILKQRNVGLTKASQQTDFVEMRQLVLPLLPAPLQTALCQCLLRGDELRVSIRSAALAARVRYVLLPQLPALQQHHPQLQRITVRTALG
jgi:hypothetical protein